MAPLDEADVPPPHARPRAARRARGVPRLEPLEHRPQPSTFTVLNANDGGPGSLRDAITQVDSDTGAGTDIIRFAVGPGHQTISLLPGRRGHGRGCWVVDLVLGKG